MNPKKSSTKLHSQFNYHTLPVTLFKWLIKSFGKETNKFTVAENYEYKKTYNKNSVQSSLKSKSVYEKPCI